MSAEEHWEKKDSDSVVTNQATGNNDSSAENPEILSPITDTDVPYRNDLGFLELIYRVLFEPVKTFRRIAGNVPTGRVVLIFSTVKVLSMVVFVMGGMYSQSIFPGPFDGGSGQAMIKMMKAMLPVLAILGVFYEFTKWFLYSGLLYFLSELFGGRGKALGVLATTGLASLPILVFMPFQILLVAFGGIELSGSVSILIGLATMVWGFILVVLGLRETQQISTGRAVAVALTPAAVAVMLLILLFVLILAVLVPMGAVLQQVGDINF